MSTRAAQYAATVLRRDQLTEHLVRLTLTGLDGFESTGIPDEWVGLVVPGQFQVRYYTVRSWDGRDLVLDVVVHDEGLVTEWATRDCTGDVVMVTEPKGSFAMPADAVWLMLVGDLTGMPAMARIAESHADRDVRVWAETPEDLPDYLPASARVTWLVTPTDGTSALAETVEAIDWPEGTGYFWMAGESAQMRAIRKHLMRGRVLPSSAYDVMGYWRAQARRPLRAVDPGPIWRSGKAAGKSDEQIWAEYDEARDA